MLETLSRWRIDNLGVSGYGTDQEFLLLQEQFAFYKPDVVLLVMSDNDEADNASNMRGGGYYKPFFVVDGGNLELRGIPVPVSEHHFLAEHKTLARSYVMRLLVKSFFRVAGPDEQIQTAPTRELVRAMADFVRVGGARLVVGQNNPRRQLSEFLEQEQIPHLSLATPHVYPTHGRHWTPEGHEQVAGKVLTFLAELGVLH